MDSINPCPDDRLAALLKSIGEDDAAALRMIAVALSDYADDPRLHFLHGSVLAQTQDYRGARAAMARAVAIAPDYAVARFQLGLLLLTNGEPHAAQEMWGPLHGTMAGSYIGDFVNGLTHMIHDRFDQAIHALSAGIARNDENAAMNQDMQLVIEELRGRKDHTETSETLSSVDLLLQQASLKATRH